MTAIATSFNSLPDCVLFNLLNSYLTRPEGKKLSLTSRRCNQVFQASLAREIRECAADPSLGALIRELDQRRGPTPALLAIANLSI